MATQCDRHTRDTYIQRETECRHVSAAVRAACLEVLTPASVCGEAETSHDRRFKCHMGLGTLE